MPLLKKLVLTSLTFVLLITYHVSLFSVPSASAQTSTSTQTWYNQSLPEWYTKVYGSPKTDVFGERYTAAQVDWILWSIISWPATKILGPDLVYCLLQSPGIVGTFVPGGRAIELSVCVAQKNIKFGVLPVEQQNKSLGELMFEDRPLSGITYFKNVARNWHLIPEANAQGFGFTSALDPVLPIWKASRNVAYGVLVLAILILSFMIMFRVKINPQTVITVQSALPKIVMALILITFSYAIAGFMVDLMYVVIGLFSLIISQAYQGFGVPSLNFFGIAGSTPANFFDLMTKGPSLGGSSSGILGAFALYLPVFVLGLLYGLFSFVGAFGAVFFGPVILLIMLIVTVVLIIITIFMIIRVLWMLLKAFAYVVLLVIFAPLQIALGIVVPGIGMGGWLRGFLSNLAVFPLTGLFISLAYLFLFAGIQLVFNTLGSGNILQQILKISFGGNVGTAAGWPPLLGGGGGVTQGLVLMGVSLVMLLILPKVSDIIKAVIEGKPFAYGTAIGEAVGPVKIAGLYGAAEGLNIAQRIAQGQNAQAPVPGWIQATRRVLNIKP